MPLVKVGMPFIQGLTSLEEDTYYNYTPGGHTLILSAVNPTRDEIEAVQEHEAVFGLFLKEATLFVLAKFGRLPWNASYYNWWINAPVMRPDPWLDLHDLSGGISVSVCLVNASNCILEALRTVTLSYEFSRAFLETVCAQTRPPFDPWRHAKVADEVTGGFATGQAGMMKDVLCMCTAPGKVGGFKSNAWAGLANTKQ